MTVRRRKDQLIAGAPAAILVAMVSACLSSHRGGGGGAAEAAAATAAFAPACRHSRRQAAASVVPPRTFAVPTAAVVHPTAQLPAPLLPPPPTVLSLASPDTDTDNGSLIQSGGGSSILNDAFKNLDVGDQYDAVLTGLCAKILDGEVTTTEPAQAATMTQSDRAYATLSDPLNLLQEMNSRRVKASPRSLGALIDAAVTTEDVRVTASVLRLAGKNRGGGINNYGSLMGTVTVLPPNPTSRVVCPDGVTRSRSERLEILPDIPSDERASEVASALSVTAVLSFCLVFRSVGSLFGFEEGAGYADLVFGTIVTFGFIDNFYDAIKGLGGFLASTQKDKIPDAVKNNVGLPDKEGMPLGLGTGQISGTVVKGLTRLLSVDTERECECEAAAFFAAYALGLPCFGFRPNALEAAVLIFESTKEDGNGGGGGGDLRAKALDPLLSDVGILKVLIWLMAPVAMESGRHAQLIASDPREGPGLLRRLREKAGAMGTSTSDLEDLLGSVGDDGGDNDGEDLDDLLKWAYAEADLLLRDNRKVVDELTERLAGGAATVGDCVAVLEGW